MRFSPLLYRRAAGRRRPRVAAKETLPDLDLNVTTHYVRTALVAALACAGCQSPDSNAASSSDTSSTSGPGMDSGSTADASSVAGTGTASETGASVGTSTETGAPSSDSDSTDTGSSPDQVRVMTWNIQGLGAPGSDEYLATLAVVQRLDADIVGLNEIDAPDLGNLSAFARSGGYDYVLVPDSNPFGTIRNAILSKLQPSDQTVWTSAELSGDRSANDVTRNPLSMTVTTAGGATLTLVSQHWNSGFGDDEEFLRAVDAVRVGQVAARAPAEFVVLGDVNAELGDRETPLVFTELPAALSELSALVGADINEMMSTDGLDNDAFSALLEGLEMEALNLAQGDGNAATRDASGRRIDYIFVTPSIHARAWAGEVYDARDDALSSLDYAGDAPSPDSTAIASDHFPVVADIRLE